MTKNEHVTGELATAAAPSRKQEIQARKIMHDYARCVVKARYARASEAILANVDNDTIAGKYSDLIRSSCMASSGGDIEMRFGGDLYRYALADALVNQQFAEAGENDFSNRLPLAHILAPSRTELDSALLKTKSKSKKKDLQENFNRASSISWLSRYGECVVRHDPVRSRLWILTPPDTPEETSRIGDLRPSFAACLGQGTLKFNRVTMRGTVAINYFRLANATVRLPADGAN